MPPLVPWKLQDSSCSLSDCAETFCSLLKPASPSHLHRRKYEKGKEGTREKSQERSSNTGLLLWFGRFMQRSESSRQIYSIFNRPNFSPSSPFPDSDQGISNMEGGYNSLIKGSFHIWRPNRGGGDKKYPQFSNKRYRFCLQRGGSGVKKGQNLVDVIYGSPLTIIM